MEETPMTPSMLSFLALARPLEDVVLGDEEFPVAPEIGWLARGYLMWGGSEHEILVRAPAIFGAARGAHVSGMRHRRLAELARALAIPALYACKLRMAAWVLQNRKCYRPEHYAKIAVQLRVAGRGATSRIATYNASKRTPKIPMVPKPRLDAAYWNHSTTLELLGSVFEALAFNSRNPTQHPWRPTAPKGYASYSNASTIPGAEAVGGYVRALEHFERCATAPGHLGIAVFDDAARAALAPRLLEVLDLWCAIRR